MFLSFTPRSAQPVADATSSTRSMGFASYIRTSLLGMLAVLGSAGMAMAQQPQWIQAKQADAQSLWLTIDNPEHKAMQVQVIQLSTNQCLVKEASHRDSYGCKLNFKGLPAGEYAVMMQVGREKYRYNVQVQPQGTQIVVRDIKQQSAVAMTSVAL